MTKLLYRIGGATQWVTLFDSSLQPQVVMPDMKGSTRWLVPSYPGLGAGSGFNSPEGNAQSSLPWRFGRSYKSEQEATASIRYMHEVFDGQKFHLQYIQDGEVQYYPNAAIELYSWEQNGAYVWHNFTFKTERITNVAPTT